MSHPEIDGAGHGVPVMPFFHTGTKWIAPLVDNDGHPQVDVLTLPGINAYNNIPFGYNAIAEESLSDTSLATGGNDLNGSPVPTGEIWVITHATIRYVGTVPTRVLITAMGLGGDISLLQQESPSSGMRYIWDGKVYLQEADYIRGRVAGATLNDALYLKYSGYKMKVA